MGSGSGASVRVLADPPPLTAPGRGASRWGDLGPRAMSAMVLVPLALLCMWAGGWAWAGLVILATAGLGWEWGHLTDLRPLSLGGLGIPVLAVGAVALGAYDVWSAALLVLAAGGILCVAVCGWRGLGLPYVGLAALGLLWLRTDPESGFVNLIFIVLIVWASDIGAYVAGRAIGGAKLAPTISPGKTISGAVGGLVAAAVAGGGVTFFASGAISWRAVTLAVVLGVVAEAGDLMESWIKRRCGKKDSSHLIPGHGGLLDRLDALMAVAPVAALLAFGLGRGVALWE